MYIHTTKDHVSKPNQDTWLVWQDFLPDRPANWKETICATEMDFQCVSTVRGVHPSYPTDVLIGTVQHTLQKGYVEPKWIFNASVQ